jgi:hypothetical protein
MPQRLSGTSDNQNLWGRFMQSGNLHLMSTPRGMIFIPILYSTIYTKRLQIISYFYQIKIFLFCLRYVVVLPLATIVAFVQVHIWGIRIQGFVCQTIIHCHQHPHVMLEKCWTLDQVREYILSKKIYAKIWYFNMIPFRPLSFARRLRSIGFQFMWSSQEGTLFAGPKTATSSTDDFRQQRRDIQEPTEEEQRRANLCNKYSDKMIKIN